MDKEILSKLGYMPKRYGSAAYSTATESAFTRAQYKARLDALAYIIRNPKLATSRTALAEAWAQVSEQPYNYRIARPALMKSDVYDILLPIMLENSIELILNGRKVKLVRSVKDLMSVIKHHYYMQIKQENAKLEEQVREYEFRMSTLEDAIIYRDCILLYTERKNAYQTELKGTQLSIPKGGAEKLLKCFETIDKLLIEDDHDFKTGEKNE